MGVNDTSALEKKIGHVFASPELLAHALTHSSYVNESAEKTSFSNERLEFFGDAVLGLVVTEELFHAFPDSPEGKLSIIKSRLVSGSRLAAYARSLGLGACLLLGKGEERLGGREKESILSSAFEAVVAAVYIDGGIEAARSFIKQVFGRDLKESGAGAEQLDYKSRLQKLTQKKYGMMPTYVVTATAGPDHRKQFRVEARIGDMLASSATGKSKKEAEQGAARCLLDMVEKI